MKKIISGILLLTLSGCATASLTPAGEKIEIVPQLDRKDCKNLGPVVGKGGGSFGGAWIADERLVEFATNDIRNKAALKGATHLVMMGHQMGQTMDRYSGTTSTATISGVAYQCN